MLNYLAISWEGPSPSSRPLILARGLLKQPGKQQRSEMEEPVRAMQTFDLRETIISFSLLQLTNHFKKMNSGDMVEIFYSDQSLLEDLKRLLPERSYEFVRIEKINAERPDFRIELKKIEVVSKPDVGLKANPGRGVQRSEYIQYSDD